MEEQRHRVQDRTETKEREKEKDPVITSTEKRKKEREQDVRETEEDGKEEIEKNKRQVKNTTTYRYFSCSSPRMCFLGALKGKKRITKK
ncbi:hypothetical protein NDU88_005641 [Pleurodeles waltl]|uniref:Uncharacterized protein n=1 Tax=Pleurodeles waltl TaxID=8319 RepID=A0AAV7PG54_PLEWA|nr:hypothetical protein NDU88_005641 [Pleurodeles waltl]